MPKNKLSAREQLPTGYPYYYVPQERQKRPQNRRCCGCFFYPLLMLFIMLAVYLLLPFATKVLVLGIDETPPGSFVGRSDTILILKTHPVPPRLTMVSIPRDLWVPLGDYGENRINTAHFFAEAEHPGSGAQNTLQTINSLFGLNLNYYVRFSFASVTSIVDSLGGITVMLDKNEGGLSAGTHVLNGAQALDFVRERKSADDFSRMRHAQLFISAFTRKLLDPASLPRYPAFLKAVEQSIDTNIPFWHMPRIAALFVTGFFAAQDSTTMDREMVTPTTTSGGAAVLLPNWDRILPYIHEKLE